MNPQLLAAGAAAGVLLMGGLAAYFVSRNTKPGREPDALARRIARVSGQSEAEEDGEGGAEESGSLFHIQRTRRGLLKYLERRFLLTGGAGVLFRGLLLGVGSGIATTLLALLLMQMGAMSLLAGSLGGVGIAWSLLISAEKKTRREFAHSFPETVDHVVRLSRTGMQAAEAIAVAGQDAPEPVGPILTEMASRLSSGLDPDVVVREIADRLRIPEFSLFTATICLQRSAGGGLTLTLTNLSTSLRERREIALKAHGATAQTRASLWVLGAVPVVVSALQWWVNPSTTDFLFQTDQGIGLIRWGVGLIVAGLLVARGLAARASR